MSEVALSLFKKHVRADDFSDDDDYLQQCLDAAEASVVRATNRTLDELKLMGGGSLPAPLGASYSVGRRLGVRPPRKRCSAAVQ